MKSKIKKWLERKEDKIIDKIAEWTEIKWLWSVNRLEQITIARICLKFEKRIYEIFRLVGMDINEEYVYDGKFVKMILKRKR